MRYCIIDCSRLTVLDSTGCQIVAASARKLASRGVATLIAGLDPANAHDRTLIDLGLDVPDPRKCWFRDLDHALERVETELEPLQSHLTAADVEAGTVLFKRGDAGDAPYVSARGLVEIRVSTDAASGILLSTPGSWPTSTCTLRRG
ncbi:MAG: STAS domain-containing protein [Betaproteobacteria bacterium]|nr:STAS domain-containing protein [Betaproteobacteria bacterium]